MFLISVTDAILFSFPPVIEYVFLLSFVISYCESSLFNESKRNKNKSSKLRIEDDDDDIYDDRISAMSPFDFLESNIKGSNNNYHTPKKKHRKEYAQSRILYDAKNAKRSYNRHGVIICSDKSSKKKDMKIIKEFLKDFFPGNSNWIKEFRHDVLCRWMKMYSISKKDLKELEKTHRKAQNAKRNSIKTEKTLDFTRRLFNVPIDRWDDPSK